MGGEFILFFNLNYLFLDRGEGREKEGEKHQCVATPTHPHWGTRPATQAYALTGNRTSDPLLPSLVLNPQSHTKQSLHFTF